VHAGWRGTSLGIAARAVRGLGERYGSRPAALVAALGPCIGPACYEVGEDVRAEFIRAGAGTAAFVPCAADAGGLGAGGPGTPEVAGASSGRKYLLDLRAANRAQLAAAGLPPAAVVDAGACTHCDVRLLSYRRDRDTTARLYNVIGLIR
jgi:copper oxidase (laccase) domain-containing protein